MPRKHPEDDIQKAIVQYAMFSLKPGYIMFAIPNGGYRRPREAARLKGLGVVAGVFDLGILGPRGQYHALEVKAPKGRMSEGQEAFKFHCITHNVPYAVVYSLDEAVRAMKEWKVVR